MLFFPSEKLLFYLLFTLLNPSCVDWLQFLCSESCFSSLLGHFRLSYLLAPAYDHAHGHLVPLLLPSSAYWKQG